MKSSTLKPVVLAIGLALSTLAGAATDSSVFNRDRGRPRNLTPPTPPCVRDRTRRFNEHIPVIPRGMADPNC